MSGFTRDPKHYGDRLVYEATISKWSRYHRHCGCVENWITAHAEPAGFTVVREGSGFVALVGPGLTEGVDESALTTAALWEAVTGKPGERGWGEFVRVIDRSEAAEARRKAENDSYYQKLRERSTVAKKAPVTPTQLKYLNSLVSKVDRERFDAEYNKAVKGTGIAARKPDEKTQQALRRLTTAAARKLISGLLI